MRIIKKIKRGVNMDKKIGVSILLGVLILIGVIGVTKGDLISEDNIVDMLGNATINLYGDGYENERVSW